MSAAATQRRGPRPVLVTLPRPTPKEFPVRFSQARGLGSLFHRPLNSYGWVGAGSVLLDQHSLRITARRRTMLGLRRIVDFVHRSEIREVYREGDSVRVDLLDGLSPSYFRFWAENAEAAAEIVARLPTNSTVEFEGAARAALEVPEARSTPRAPWVTAVVVLMVGLTWLGTRFIPTSSPVPAAPAVTPPALHLRAAPVQPARTQLPAYDLWAVQDLERFIPRFDALEAQFSVAFESLQLGTISQADFSEDLQRMLIPQWHGVADELGTPVGEMTAQRIKADDQLHHVIECWIRALNLYAQGLRDRDYRQVLHSFDVMRDADNYESQADTFLHQMQASR